MPKVILKTLMAGPNGVYNEGQTVEFDKAQAEALVMGGYAEYVDPKAQEKAKEAIIEAQLTAQAEAETKAQEKAKKESPSEQQPEG
jgi:hypothetical protein